MRVKALESVSDAIGAVFSSAFGHFRFNRCALCGVRGRNAAKQRRPFAGPDVREPRAAGRGLRPQRSRQDDLLRLLIGELLPDTGSVKLGANLVPVVIDQRRANLDPDKTPWEILADRNDHLLVRGRQMHVMSYLREYLFRDEQARQPVHTLSGGERNRLLLAKALAAPSNLLVLDEPTNDLDADTLDLLQEALRPSSMPAATATM